MARKKSTNLTLSIKQKYFDEILSGEKTEEERMAWHDGMSRYCEVDGDGRPLLDGDGVPVPRRYETVTFLTGAYRGTRPRMVVEVADIAVSYVTFEGAAEMGIEVERDEDESPGDPIGYEDDEGNEHFVTAVRYELGRVLERPPGPAET